MFDYFAKIGLSNRSGRLRTYYPGRTRSLPCHRVPYLLQDQPSGSPHPLGRLPIPSPPIRDPDHRISVFICKKIRTCSITTTTKSYCYRIVHRFIILVFNQPRQVLPGRQRHQELVLCRRIHRKWNRSRISLRSPR